MLLMKRLLFATTAFALLVTCTPPLFAQREYESERPAREKAVETLIRAASREAAGRQGLESDEVVRISSWNTPVVGPVSVSVTGIPVVSAWDVTVTVAPVSFRAAPQ